MNGEELAAGIQYFNFVVQEYQRYVAMASTGSAFRCPWTQQSLGDRERIRQYAMPFLIAGRNAILARPRDFVDDMGQPRAVLNRFYDFFHWMRVESPSDWFEAEQQYESLLVFGERQNLEDMSLNERTRISRFQNWQLTVFLGRLEELSVPGYRYAHMNFNIVGEQSRQDHAQVMAHLPNSQGQGHYNYLAFMQQRVQMAGEQFEVVNVGGGEHQNDWHLTPNPLPLLFQNRPVVQVFDLYDAQLRRQLETIYRSLCSNHHGRQRTPSLSRYYEAVPGQLREEMSRRQWDFGGLFKEFSENFAIQNPPVSSPVRRRIVVIPENEQPGHEAGEVPYALLSNSSLQETVPVASDSQAQTQVHIDNDTEGAPENAAATPVPSIAQSAQQTFLSSQREGWSEIEEERTFNQASQGLLRNTLTELLRRNLSDEENPEGDVYELQREYLSLVDNTFFTHRARARLSNLPLVGPYQRTLALPRLPIVQPYHPEDNARIDFTHEDQVAHGHVRISVAVQMPVLASGLPFGVMELLAAAEVEIESVDLFLAIQDNPWEQETPLLLRVHPYIHPNATEGGNESFNTPVRVSIADVGRQFSMWEPYRVHTHQGVFSPNNMQILGNNQPESSHTFYSLVLNEANHRVALTLHVLLNDYDQSLLTALLDNPGFDVPGIDVLDFFLREAANINIAMDMEVLPVRELRYLRSELIRPPINGPVPFSLRRLLPQHQAPMEADINLRFSGRRLEDQFHGNHSAGGANPALERATNRAGLALVERGLGPNFVRLDARGNVLPLTQKEDIEQLEVLTEELLGIFRQRLLAQGLDPEHYRDLSQGAVYFHPYAVSMRALLHNTKIRGDGPPDFRHAHHHGMLLREILAIWSLIRRLPEENRYDYLDNLCLELYEIQRAYNISNFYIGLVGADERHSKEWLSTSSSSRGISYVTILAWYREFCEHLAELKSLYVQAPVRPLPASGIGEELSAEEQALVLAHRESEHRATVFDEYYEQLRLFVRTLEDHHETALKTRQEHARYPARNPVLPSDILIKITKDMAGYNDRMEVVRTGDIQVLLFFCELYNAWRFPNSPIHTDNFTEDGPSCAPGSETRLLNVANLLPNVDIVSLSPYDAMILLLKVLEDYYHGVVQCVIEQRPDYLRDALREALSTTDITPSQQDALNALFSELAQALQQTLIRLSEQRSELREAIQVRNPVTGGLTMDETIQHLLESNNIRSQAPFVSGPLVVHPQYNVNVLLDDHQALHASPMQGAWLGETMRNTHNRLQALGRGLLDDSDDDEMTGVVARPALSPSLSPSVTPLLRRQRAAVYGSGEETSQVLIEAEMQSAARAIAEADADAGEVADSEEEEEADATPESPTPSF